MVSLSGIISLQEAMNADTIALPSLNRQQLQLGNIEESETCRKSYYQPILYDGQKLRIQTPAVHMASLTYNKYSSGVAVLISISTWLRQQFKILDEFVRDNVIVPETLKSDIVFGQRLYKSIQHGENIYLILDKSCTMTQESEDGIIDLTPQSQPSLGEGYYSFAIEFQHVYFGYHYYGYLYSINYRIKHIHFKPSKHSSS